MKDHECMKPWCCLVTDDYKGRSYRVQVIKNGHIITRMKRHVRATQISAEDHLRKVMSKANRPQTNNKLNEFMDHCFTEPK